MAIHRLVLTSGLNDIDSGLTNNMLCDCWSCDYPIATFTNNHNSALTLTNVIVTYSSLAHVYQINGAPVSLSLIHI